jgi:NADH-quinone oxidoreductase subunit F
MSQHVLLRHRDIPDINKLDVYQSHDGFKPFKQVVTSMKPEEVTEIVKVSGLRGRGGAGFPTGVKWGFMDNSNWPHYFVANADESEPGTFKDREIMESNPFQFLEGLAISSFAIGAKAAYIYLRGEFWQVAHYLDEKIAELENAKLLGDNLFGTDYSLRIYTHLGAGAYICGEETALLESMEGKRGQPRLRPPFPPSYGLFGKPTIVNNVETLTNVPAIITNGGEWYQSLGTEDTAGVKVFSGGGIIDDVPIKAIMAAGASSSMIVADDKALDTPMDYASVRTLDADLGSASVIVMDETIDIDWVINKTISFFKHESCGKCTPCREGNYWMHSLTERIHKGDGSREDVELLYSVADNIKGKCLCALGEFSIQAVLTGIERFPNDFETKVR